MEREGVRGGTETTSEGKWPINSEVMPERKRKDGGRKGKQDHIPPAPKCSHRERFRREQK